MKKHKSVVAILLAVMMIFTMMPMMAFADTNPPASKITSWGTLYATATGDNGIEFTTQRVYSDGIIIANPKDKDDGSIGGETWAAPAAQAQYYDLDGSKFFYGTGTAAKELNGTTWARDKFAEVIGGQVAVNVVLVEPSYTDSYKEAIKANPNYKAKTTEVSVNIAPKADSENTYTGTATFGVWTLTLKDFVFDSDATGDQTVKLEVKSIDPDKDAETDGVKAADLNGTVELAEITVKGKAKTPADANFYLDKVGGAALDEGVYDGKAHTVVVDETPGYTWSYQVKNAQGKFEDVSAVTVTDVTDPITFKAFYTDSKAVKTLKGTYSVVLNPLVAANRGVVIGWDEKANMAEVYDDEYYTSVLYLVDGTDYDVNKFVAMTAYEEKAEPKETADAAAIRVAKNEAAKSALAANEAQLKEWFNTFYELKDVTTKRNAANDQVVFEISKRVLSAAEDKAANEKFAQLLKNFGSFKLDGATFDGIVVQEGRRATLQLNADKIDYEIEFTKAPEGAKVIHIKKAKKLKKNTSFTVKAVSNKGVAVSYKLINANSKIKINKTTGKITVKKGLKKGTYKFKVKAYVPGHSDWAYEIQNVTVKIKK